MLLLEKQRKRNLGELWSEKRKNEGFTVGLENEKMCSVFKSLQIPQQL